MKTTLTLILFAALPAFVRAKAPPGAAPKAAAAKAESPASQQLSGLSSMLTAGLKDRPGIKLAVLSFAYTDGKASEGPVVVQERMTTLLAQNKGITLVERGLMEKVMGELKLEASGAMDEDTVQKLGKLLGADAVVTGTLNDVDDAKTEVNARVVETGTGKILCAASSTIDKTWKDTARTPSEPPADFGGKPLVQVAILLDTSNSMDGLINQARTQIWKIVNTLVSSEKSGSTPVIQVALYEYGNSGLPRENDWIRQVLPFTTDLDSVSRELFALKTNGGEEYCGEVMKRAVEDLKWSPKSDVYKAIFIAGNEPFTQGPVDFRASAAEAEAKGIFVNTIYCGSRQQGIAEQWKTGAELAEGDYASIDQEAQNYAVAAPQDDRISELSAKLNETYVPYGASGAKGIAFKKESAALARGAGSSVMAERAAFQAAAPAAAADSSWDVVSAIESGSISRDKIKQDQLPADLKKMDKKELDRYLDAKLTERKKIKDEINSLQAERQAYVKAQEKTGAPGANTLDKAIISTIHKQAGKRGYKFAH
jgi:curli biogenesis system outer membrane secretion channel CsgG